MKLLSFIHSLLAALLLFNACVPVDTQSGQASQGGSTVKTQTQDKELIFDDRVYEDGFKTVLLYPSTGAATIVDANTPPQLRPPVVPIQQTIPLLLEFDHIGPDIESYYIKIINCNYDWTPSTLNSLQYMNEYNEVFVGDRRTAFSTRTPYVHYKINLPRVKVSGNYLVVVYRDQNESDIVISRRYIVADNLVEIGATPKFSTVLNERNYNQQVDFNVLYGKYDLVNPLQNVKVCLRQNYRFDNMICGLQPAGLREFEKRLEYFYFAGENNFRGGNEFRVFDIRSDRFNGFNVGKITTDSNNIIVNRLLFDQTRRNRAYGLTIDKNGWYYPQKYETGNQDVEPDYVYVDFTLESPKVNGKVFVFGAFTNWQLLPEYEMEFNEKLQMYTCRAFLKQGYYNYKYVTLTPDGRRDEEYFEGTSSQAENVYDIIVYYRPLGARSDLVVGYKAVGYLGR